MKKVSAVLLIVIFILIGFTSGAVSGEFPNEPIEMVLGFGVGGMTDASARIIADGMEKYLGQPVIVENKPGVAGYLALREVIDSAEPDGYTMVSLSTSTAAATVLYDEAFELDEVKIVCSTMPQERVIFARKNAPFDTFDEFLEYASENPVTVGIGGPIWAEQIFKAMNKYYDLNLREALFNSGGEASAAILGGHVTLAEAGVGTTAWESALAGELKIIALITDGDLGNHGYEDMDYDNLLDLGFEYAMSMYYGFAVPADTPDERVKILEEAFKNALADEEVISRMGNLDLIPNFRSSEEYTTIVRNTLESVVSLREYLEAE